jgi:hypothetical protein
VRLISRARSVGYVGFSDGWQDLMAHFKMDWQFSHPRDGNIALMGEIDLSDGMEFTLGVGFGRTSQSACAHLLQAFATPFVEQRARYLRQWQRGHAKSICTRTPATRFADALESLRVAGARTRFSKARSWRR